MTIESAGLPLRTFRVGIKSGKHGEFLGTVEAVDQEAAEAAAAEAQLHITCVRNAKTILHKSATTWRARNHG